MQNLINRLIVFLGIPILRLVIKLPGDYLNEARRSEITELLEEYELKRISHQ